MARDFAVGDDIAAGNGAWTFEGVSDTFDEHVSKSVPLYREAHELVAKMTDYFLPTGSTCYDLGCSTGSLIATLAERNTAKDVRFVGVDVDEGMCRFASDRCAPYPNVSIVNADILDVDPTGADVIIAFYTIQFVKPRDRQALFDRLYSALNWGGALFLFEKVRGPDARFQDVITGVYTDYKLEQGYSPDEIVGKSRSLKSVLEPFSTAGNLGLLERSGFVDIMTVFKYACFEGFLAIK